jgi:hypothetical protein
MWPILNNERERGRQSCQCILAIFFGLCNRPIFIKEGKNSEDGA